MNIKYEHNDYQIVRVEDDKVELWHKEDGKLQELTYPLRIPEDVMDVVIENETPGNVEDENRPVTIGVLKSLLRIMNRSWSYQDKR